MASQTVMTLYSSSTPKLATFNSPTLTLLPRPPPRSFSCSSSLPTPCLKASFRGIRALPTSRDFKCHVNITTGAVDTNVTGGTFGGVSNVTGGKSGGVSNLSALPGTTATSGGSPTSGDGKPSVAPGGWHSALKADGNEEVQTLGKYAVDEYNKEYGTQIQFDSVVDWARQVAAEGILRYDLSIQAKIGAVVKIVKACVSFGQFST